MLQLTSALKIFEPTAQDFTRKLKKLEEVKNLNWLSHEITCICKWQKRVFGFITAHPRQQVTGTCMLLFSADKL